MINLSQKEIALQKLKEAANKFGNKENIIHSANEATTRLIIIDEILRILGWNSEEFNPETHTSTNGYIDYLLKHNSTPKLVVEAKK
ncbi:hypothetical protein [Shewanella algae]